MRTCFVRNLASSFRDLGVAAAYAFAAGIAVALIGVNDDRSLGLGWILFDLGALPSGVLALICCEAAIATLQGMRGRSSAAALLRR